MSTSEILIILFIHWFADFVLQTREMADNKSTSNYWLFMHVLTYSYVWFIVGVFLFDNKEVLYTFVSLTFICHFATDYITSRITSRLYKKGKIKSFFTTIGFDQYLHYLQLILLYEYLT